MSCFVQGKKEDMERLEQLFIDGELTLFGESSNMIDAEASIPVAVEAEKARSKPQKRE